MAPKEYVSEDENLTFYFRDPEMTVWHRERGLPACEWHDGDKEYFENNMRHKLDGIAFDFCGFRKFHHLNGKRLFKNY